MGEAQASGDPSTHTWILFWLSKQDSSSLHQPKRSFAAVDTPVYEVAGRMWLDYLYIYVQNNVFLQNVTTTANDVPIVYTENWYHSSTT